MLTPLDVYLNHLVRVIMRIYAMVKVTWDLVTSSYGTRDELNPVDILSVEGDNNSCIASS